MLDQIHYLGTRWRINYKRWSSRLCQATVRAQLRTILRPGYYWGSQNAICRIESQLAATAIFYSRPSKLFRTASNARSELVMWHVSAIQTERVGFLNHMNVTIRLECCFNHQQTSLTAGHYLVSPDPWYQCEIMLSNFLPSLGRPTA